ncbi:hypothetical protein BDD12DRAFT_833900 [Trichophaea hybrida]|nr:hypothetical protein BDD12DRAFT_833900 [Trichophaea hybrida]
MYSIRMAPIVKIPSSQSGISMSPALASRASSDSPCRACKPLPPVPMEEVSPTITTYPQSGGSSPSLLYKPLPPLPRTYPAPLPTRTFERIYSYTPTETSSSSSIRPSPTSLPAVLASLLTHTATLHSGILYFATLVFTTDLSTKVLRFHYNSIEETLSALQQDFARVLSEYVKHVTEWECHEEWKRAELVQVKRLLIRLEDDLEECEGLLDEAVKLTGPIASVLHSETVALTNE